MKCRCGAPLIRRNQVRCTTCAHKRALRYNIKRERKRRNLKPEKPSKFWGDKGWIAQYFRSWENEMMNS